MIITLCGSTRFKNQFNDANFWLTIRGWIVLSVGSFLHSDNDPEIREVIEKHKVGLDRLHKKKIVMSEAVMVIDVDDYIGESTLSEIKYAYRMGNPRGPTKIYSYTKSKEAAEDLTKLKPFDVKALLKK